MTLAQGSSSYNGQCFFSQLFWF